MERRSILRGIGIPLATTLAGCSGGGGSIAQQTTEEANTVEVDLDDYEFDPGTESTLEIQSGTTVKFVWKTGGHNIHVEKQPDGADWQGYEDIEDAGFTYKHTFDTTGKYHFWCVPHKSLGMIGDIQIT